MRQKNKIFLAASLFLALAAVLRFWKIGSLEIQHDMALNAVRALGWFDFLVGVGQTTPIVWFGHIPWWANLSFHDHPPLAFLLQHLSFLFFSDTSFAAFLPFALAGSATAFSLFWFTKQFRSSAEGVLALGFFSVSAYALWASRTGYLEGISVLFITLSFFFFLKFLRDDKRGSALWWGVTTALALLSKYTSVFILAAAGGYVLVFRRALLKSSKFWLGIAVMLLLLTPVIFYNVQVFLARGHFDAALSSMLGMHPADFEVISERGTNLSILKNLSSEFYSLRAVSSWPFFILGLGSLVGLGVLIGKKQADEFLKFLSLSIGMLVVMFAFAGAAERFLSIVVPFLSLAAAAVGYRIWQGAAFRRTGKRVLMVLLIVVMGWELFYAVNTNILDRPLGKEGLAYSSLKRYRSGVGQLDNYLRKERVLKPLPAKRKFDTLEELEAFTVAGNQLVIVDDRFDWFLAMWYLRRYNFYADSAVLPLSDLLAEFGGKNIDPFKELARRGISQFWFVETLPAGQDTSAVGAAYADTVQNILTSLQEANIPVVKEIKNYKGETVFRIYRFSVNF